MGYDKYLHIGDRVNILYDGDTYNSKIVRFIKKIKGVENIVILLPTKNNLSMKTDDDKKKYEVLFYTKGGIYKGDCKIKDKYREDGVVAVLEIAIISDLEKYQRREYYRIDYIDKIQFKVLQSKNEETGALEENEDVWHNGTLTNISGGGLRFNSSEGMENAKKVQVKFKLKDHEDDGEYDIEADIVGVNIRSHVDKKYDYRIQFTKINKVERENIVRFVFERERWMRKKSIGKI